MFPRIADAYTAHPDTCISLPYYWLGRTGGVSSPGDIDTCDGCDQTFYNEGLAWINYDDPEAETEIRYCGCCANAHGILLVATPHGINQPTNP